MDAIESKRIDAIATCDDHIHRLEAEIREWQRIKAALIARQGNG